MPEVWLVLPTANPTNCSRTLPAWRDMGYRVAVLQDRVRFDTSADRVLHAEQYPGWPASVNRLFREAVPADVRAIVAAGDDMWPDPNHRAETLLEQFLDRFDGDFGVMQPVGDDFEATDRICGSPWMGRRWMERMYGGFGSGRDGSSGGLCEAYHHNWADEELHWVARCSNRLWTRPDLTQRHDHFRRLGEPAPEYWVRSASDHDRRDNLTFIARAHAGFPGAAPADEPTLVDTDRFRAEYDGRAERMFEASNGASKTNEASDRLARALAECAQQGQNRVAVYGAGQHTRRAADALRDPPVRVVAIVDDDRARVGTRLWNYPVRSPDEACALGLDAVVVSSDAHENTLAERAERWAPPGTGVVRLYCKAYALRKGA